MLRPRIVVLFAGMININRSYTQLWPTLTHTAPEYISIIDVSNSRFDIIISVLETADHIAVDHSILQAINACSLSSNRNLRGVVPSRPPDKHVLESIWFHILQSKKTKSYIASGWDLHWRSQHLETLLGAGFTSLFWAFGGKPKSFLDVPAAHRDPWMTDDAQVGEGEIRCDPLRVWFELRLAFPTIVEIAHSLDGSEFRQSNGSKWFDLVIPGERYATRRIAMSSAKGKCTLTPYRALDRSIRFSGIAAARAIGTNSASKAIIRARQATQSATVSISRAAYTDGSGLDYPVRKFIEIPAQGTLMFAYSSDTLQRLGFVPQMHYLETSPEDLGSLVAGMHRRTSQFDGIRRRAFDFVANEHSATRRAQQFVEVLTRVAEGRVSSARYEDGQFTIDS